MTEKSDICLLALILLSSLFTGVSGAEVSRVFISSGESASLPCNDTLHQCSSTTWIYNNYTSSSAVEVFAGGINKNNSERSERMSMTSDCSLNIYNTTQHDGGVYTCRRYVNGLQEGPDSQVYLHVLHVSSSSSSSSSQTEIRANTPVTLSCQLWSHDSCDYLLRVDGFQLVWMNQADVDLQTDSRYQIRSDEHDCLISLTTTLVNEDNNTELRCVLKHKNDIKTSVTHTVRFTVTNSQIVTIAVIAPLLLLLTVAVLCVIYIKRTDPRLSGDPVVTSKNGNNGTYDTINILPPTPGTNKDDVVYSEVTIASKKQLKSNNVQSASDVTYAVIR
ncbi:uncharacterized protein LOC130547731 isoform X2 [Triplophysa rosa]|uniref:uncharacterized protein LOC130547731 isoform X2 n=1 Tax=Triplophysa rosa TaxID=992332 RepID=UPI002545E27D|nr:uncharacterized protein LOC130547731 isoform X2 [Triplophysa rosa]